MADNARAGGGARFRIRDLQAGDVDAVAGFEATIALRSFGDEAVTDPAHYAKKINKLVRYREDWTKVVEAGATVCGWAWVASRQNFVTGDRYADFRSFYVDGATAGPAAAVALLRAVLGFCEAEGFRRIVGRTASGNAAMRGLYELAGFSERHIVYELDIGAGREIG